MRRLQLRRSAPTMVLSRTWLCFLDLICDLFASYSPPAIRETPSKAGGDINTGCRIHKEGIQRSNQKHRVHQVRMAARDTPGLRHDSNHAASRRTPKSHPPFLGKSSKPRGRTFWNEAERRRHNSLQRVSRVISFLVRAIISDMLQRVAPCSDLPRMKHIPMQRLEYHGKHDTPPKNP